MTVQTSITDEPPIGREGLLADAGNRHVTSKLADGAQAAGKAALRSGHPDTSTGSPGLVAEPAADPAIGADVDAIAATIASSASSQSISGASLDGDVGTGRMFPPRQLQLVLDSHTDWDATTATVTGRDANGKVITEELSIPDNGNATVNGSKYFSEVTQLDLEAQTGAGGTATLGIQDGGGPVTGVDIEGVLVYLQAVEAGTETQEFEDEDAVNCLRKGRIYVETEDACTPYDQPYVRVTAAGSEELGSFRSDADGTDAVPLEGARFLLSSGAGEINILEVDL